MTETKPTGGEVIDERNGDGRRSRHLVAITTGAVSAFVLSLLFSVPLVPVLIGIAVSARLGKSGHWRSGFLYGAAIGPSGYAVRTFLYRPDLAPALWQKGLVLLGTAALFGLVGIGINKLVTGRGSVMW